MPIELRLGDTAAFARAAAAVQRAADKDLPFELRRGVQRAGRQVEAAVRATTDDYIPRDFETEFKQALEARVSVRQVGGGATATVVFSALGKGGNPRKLDLMDKGTLKHPVYGRTRRVKRLSKYKATSIRNPWSVQKIRAGVVTEPAMAARPAVRRELEQAVDNVTDKIRKAL